MIRDKFGNALSFWEFLIEVVDVYGLDDPETEDDFLNIYDISWGPENE